MDSYELYGKFRNEEEKQRLKDKLIEYYGVVREIVLKEYGSQLTPAKRVLIENTRAEDVIVFLDGPGAPIANFEGKIRFRIDTIVGMYEQLSGILTKDNGVDKNSKLVDTEQILTTEKGDIDVLKHIVNAEIDVEKFCLSTILHETGHTLINIPGGFLNEGFAELVGRKMASKYPHLLKYWMPDRSKECKFARQVEQRLGENWSKIVLSGNIEKIIDNLGEEFKQSYETNKQKYREFLEKTKVAANNMNYLDFIKLRENLDLVYLDERKDKKELIKGINSKVNIEESVRNTESLSMMCRIGKTQKIIQKSKLR